MPRTVKRIYRDFSTAEKVRIDKLRAEVEKERPEIEADLLAMELAHQSAMKVISDLRKERERQGLSLADLQERTGISRAAISTMENSDSPNPTVKTLQRYALALGKRLSLTIR